VSESKVNPKPFSKVFHLLRLEKKEISSIYFYSIVSGLIQLVIPLGIQSIISLVVGVAISTSLVLLIAFVIIAVMINGFVQVNQMKFIERIEQKIFVRYAVLYASKLPNIDIRKTKKYFLPETVNRFFDTISLQKGIAKLLLDVPVATIQIVFGLVLLSFYNPVFIGFGLVLCIVLYFIIRITGKRGLTTSLAESDYKYKVAFWLEDIARNVVPFKFRVDKNFHLKVADEKVSGYVHYRTEHFKVLIIQYWSLIVFKVILTAAMLIIGASLLISQSINIGQFIATEIVIIMVINSVEKLIANLDKVYDVITSLEKLDKLIELPSEPKGEQIMSENDILHIKLSSKINTPLVNEERELRVEMKAGDRILVHGDDYPALMRFMQNVSTAAISSDEFAYVINNIAVEQYYLPTLRSHIGELLRSSKLFEGTLLENITMFHHNYDKNLFNRLILILNLDTLIEESDDGLLLHINPSGDNLPYNFIRKILIMRALLNKPKLIVLDDPYFGIEREVIVNLNEYFETECKDSIIILRSDNAFALKQAKRKLEISKLGIKETFHN